jgi:3-hydroxy-9,10-secoandrosta-1,3,5(10)-triene-9,17-dione monooxygenase reductase component
MGLPRPRGNGPSGNGPHAVTAPLAAIGLGDGLTQSGVDGPALRAFMRNWPGGVAIVTARRGRQPIGCTVTAFISVSLNPPLVLVSLAEQSRTRSAITAQGAFGVNVIGCSVDQVLAASDHILIFGRPTWCDHDAGADPVILFGGAYSPLDAQALSTFHGGNE